MTMLMAALSRVVRMADVFTREDVRRVLGGRQVLLLGDSVLRNLYQDLVWLAEKGTLTPNEVSPPPPPWPGAEEERGAGVAGGLAGRLHGARHRPGQWRQEVHRGGCRCCTLYFQKAFRRGVNKMFVFGLV